jgi:hypothetical protein
LSHPHAHQLLRSPVFVENVIGILSEFFHICPDKHLSQFDEITVLLVIHLDNSPRIRAPAYLSAIGSDDNFVRSNNCEGDFAGNLFVLGNGLLVLVVIRGSLEDVNIVMSDVRENLATRLIRAKAGG